MKPTLTLALSGLCVALLGTPSLAQQRSDVDELHELVRQVCAELRALRAQVGSGSEEHGEGRGEGRGEHGEHGEGRGESRGGEEGGVRVAKDAKWDETRNGARLVLAYNAATRSFQGTVHNTTSKTLSAVRVEVHLSNGVELGPTKRADLKAGAKLPVELSAAGQEFTWWTTHPEHGSEEAHGAEHGGEEGRGEHGEGREAAENRPKDPALRPLYNELLLLRRELEMLSESLQRGRPRRR